MTAVTLDPHAVCADPAMPFIALALDPAYMQPRLRSITAGAGEGVALRAIRVVRWKPGRRCLLEYQLSGANGSGCCRTLMGKVRARSFDAPTYALARQLGANGFGADSVDGISVPPVRGVVPECHMWLQDKVPGTPGWEAISGAKGVHAARRIGAAIAKLQRALPPSAKRHSMADEVVALSGALDNVRALLPKWDVRLRAVQRACELLAAGAGATPKSSVHRDFYHDQVIVDGERVWLLDLDIVAEGDPALDAGNFTAHLVEQSLRLLGNPNALGAQEDAFVSAFREAGGDADFESIEIYKTLSLARHIHLTTTFESRRRYTNALLTLCENRLRLSRV